MLAHRWAVGPRLRSRRPNVRLWRGRPCPQGHGRTPLLVVPLLRCCCSRGRGCPPEALVDDVDELALVVVCLLSGRGRPWRWGSTSPAPARIGAPCYLRPPCSDQLPPAAVSLVGVLVIEHRRRGRTCLAATFVVAPVPHPLDRGVSVALVALPPWSDPNGVATLLQPCYGRCLALAHDGSIAELP